MKSSILSHTHTPCVSQRELESAETAWTQETHQLQEALLQASLLGSSSKDEEVAAGALTKPSAWPPAPPAASPQLVIDVV